MQITCQKIIVQVNAHTHTHNHFTAFLEYVRDHRVSRYQKGKTNLDLLEQEIVSGSGICWVNVIPAYLNIPPSLW